jgi:hypothetical protein
MSLVKQLWDISKLYIDNHTVFMFNFINVFLIYSCLSFEWKALFIKFDVFFF